MYIATRAVSEISRVFSIFGKDTMIARQLTMEIMILVCKLNHHRRVVVLGKIFELKLPIKD